MHSKQSQDLAKSTSNKSRDEKIDAIMRKANNKLTEIERRESASVSSVLAFKTSKS